MVKKNETADDAYAAGVRDCLQRLWLVRQRIEAELSAFADCERLISERTSKRSDSE